MSPVPSIDCLFAGRIPNSTEAAGLRGAGPLEQLPCLTNLASIVKEMERQGIDRALLTPCQTGAAKCDRQYLCADAATTDLLHCLSIYPSRFSALVGYNPHDIASSLMEIERAIEDYDCKGLYISVRDLALLDRRMYPAYAKCAELRVPIMVHAAQELAWADQWPMLKDMNRVAADFPDLTVVAACGCWPPLVEVRSLLERYDNVYLALDGNPRRDLVSEVSELLNSEFGERCLWGSNGCPWGAAIEHLSRLVLEDHALLGFVRDNAIRVFALEQQERPRIEVDGVVTAE